MDNRKRVALVVVIASALVAAAGAGGCAAASGPGERDISGLVATHPWMASGYKIGSVYELVTPVYVVGASNHSVLVKLESENPPLESYRAAPQRYPRLKGVLPAGTRMIIRRMVHVPGRLGAVVTAHAEIQGSSMAGWIADLNPISALNFDTPVFLAIPDKRFIREVTLPTNTPSGAAPE